jgi:hypothetical protein
VVVHKSFDSYCRDDQFGTLDARLHVGLLPLPYVGDLTTADIFILLANPGLSHADYWAEEHVPAYRHRLLNNLSQAEADPFLFLDPALSWHPGGQYWLSRFQDLAGSLQSDRISFRDSLDLMRKHVACLELVPYHSTGFRLPGRLVDSLESVRLMIDFVNHDLAPRALRGEVLLVVTRQVFRWGIDASCANIVRYGPGQARSASISPATDGGKAILRFLKQT